MIDVLKKIPLFSTLKEEELEAISKVSVNRTFNKDQIILLENEDGDTLFIIIDGKVKVTAFSENGKEVILSILYENDFFGDMSLLDGKPRSASVVAIEDSHVRMIRRPEFKKLIEDHPGIALKLLEALASRLRKADERIESLALLDVTGRLAGIILQLAADKSEETPEGTVIKSRPTHQELANMAGTTRETVTRILKQLENKGYIELQGRNLVILDRETFKSDLYL